MAAVEPPLQYEPAGHGNEHAAVAPVAFEYVPAAHGVKVLEPAGQKAPAGHSTCVALLELAGQ